MVGGVSLHSFSIELPIPCLIKQCSEDQVWGNCDAIPPRPEFSCFLYLFTVILTSMGKGLIILNGSGKGGIGSQAAEAFRANPTLHRVNERREKNGVLSDRGRARCRRRSPQHVLECAAAA